ncbi:unnamed protein product [Anisakis simplex]|uniref:PHD-type domain-containing protein n=1 Tax=Anisakis simplex TaxID=6269 RepID=A0A0M3KAF3_ANISI|nr:unnamed protein product [Anisakis simplex]
MWQVPILSELITSTVVGTAETILSESSYRGIGLEAVEQIWSDIQKSDWMSETNIDRLRSELIKARRIEKSFQKAKKGECTLKELKEVEEDCKGSIFMNESQSHHELSDTSSRLESFCERLKQMFVNTHSYYSLVEILIGRDDLATLIEGSPLPLGRFSSRSLRDELLQLDQFESVEQMTNHLNCVYEQQQRLMTVLRSANESRSLKQTCSCSSDKDDPDGSIRCFLCHSKFHANCIQWDPSLSHLPVGYYLCVRCLRSKRPFIEDVRCASQTAPLSLEKTLVTHLLTRCANDYKQTMDLLNQIQSTSSVTDQDLLKKLDSSLISVLCAEMVDVDSWSNIVSAFKLLHEISDDERVTYEKIRLRPCGVNAEPPFIIFTLGVNLKKTKRRSSTSTTTTAQRHRKRGRNIYHNDKEQCSAETCLKPYSEQVRWIQCEAGCSRWYHYVCVGQSYRLHFESSFYTLIVQQIVVNNFLIGFIAIWSTLNLSSAIHSTELIESILTNNLSPLFEVIYQV